MKIAIVGSGNGVVTAAVDMVGKGRDVRLYCRNESISRFDVVLERDGFDFNNEREGKFIEFTDISNDVKCVLDGANVIQIITPSSFIEYYAKVMSKFVTNNHLVFFNIAVSVGSTRFVNVLEDCHIDIHPHFAEANTLTYGTRIDFNNAKVDLSLDVRRVFFSTFDRSELSESYKKVPKIYDCLVKEEGLLKTSLENGNPEVHPGSTLLNIGCIDYSEEFSLYKESITKHTVRLLHTIKIERLSLGRKLGFRSSTARESHIQGGYLERKDEDRPLNRSFNINPVFSQVPGPNHVENRYLTEDIACRSVLWSSLGRVIGVPTPNIDAVIIITSAIFEHDFFEEDLTIEELSLDKLGLG